MTDTGDTALYLVVRVVKIARYRVRYTIAAP